MRKAVLIPVLAALACTAAPKPDPMLEQGRLYTSWLFGGRFDQLHARFSPEMQRTFPSVAALSAFVSHTTAELGAERGQPAEQVTSLGDTRVYTRTAQFARSDRPVEVQWTVNQAGQVTGLLVHPVPADSAPAGPDSAPR
jgi:hypothetical protein